MLNIKEKIVSSSYNKIQLTFIIQLKHSLKYFPYFPFFIQVWNDMRAIK